MKQKRHLITWLLIALLILTLSACRAGGSSAATDGSGDSTTTPPPTATSTAATDTAPTVTTETDTTATPTVTDPAPEALSPEKLALLQSVLDGAEKTMSSLLNYTVHTTVGDAPTETVRIEGLFSDVPAAQYTETTDRGTAQVTLIHGSIYYDLGAAGRYNLFIYSVDWQRMFDALADQSFDMPSTTQYTSHAIEETADGYVITLSEPTASTFTALRAHFGKDYANINAEQAQTTCTLHISKDNKLTLRRIEITYPDGGTEKTVRFEERFEEIGTASRVARPTDHESYELRLYEDFFNLPTESKMVIVEDLNGNGAPEVLTLAREGGSGDITVTIYDTGYAVILGQERAENMYGAVGIYLYHGEEGTPCLLIYKMARSSTMSTYEYTIQRLLPVQDNFYTRRETLVREQFHIDTGYTSVESTLPKLAEYLNTLNGYLAESTLIFDSSDTVCHYAGEFEKGGFLCKPDWLFCDYDPDFPRDMLTEKSILTNGNQRSVIYEKPNDTSVILGYLEPGESIPSPAYNSSWCIVWLGDRFGYTFYVHGMTRTPVQ